MLHDSGGLLSGCKSPEKAYAPGICLVVNIHRRDQAWKSRARGIG